MTLTVTYSDGTVAKLPIKTTLEGRAFCGVVKNGLAVLTDKLIKHNSIPENATIVSAVACGRS